MDYSPLALVLFGVIFGSFLGVEYGNWRIGRRLSKYTKLLFELIELDPKEFEKLSPKEKRKLLGKKITALFEELFPPTMPIRPPPPSRVIHTLSGTVYAPHCPHCYYVGAAVEAKPGEWVEATCPTHGKYKQQVPGKEEE